MANNAEVLMKALEYIENNIASEIAVTDIADHCFVSTSQLQKTFRYVFHLSVKEYMIRRRFSCAAKDLLSCETTILDTALNYGYANAESFTRGFYRIWGITPSEYRKTRHFAGHTPKLAMPQDLTNKEEQFMSGIRYDLTELYNVLQERKNKAYVCADLSHLQWINTNQGREAGDAALLELMKRVEKSCNERDIFLRVGGDEFVVFTDSEKMNHANDIVREVNLQNGQTIQCGNLEISVSIHIGAFKQKFDGHVNATEMFALITDGMKEIHN